MFCCACAGTWRNIDARNILPSYGIRILPTYDATVAMSEFHRPYKWGEGMECTHFCQPSAPQLGVVALVKELRKAKLPPPVPAEQKSHMRGSIRWMEQAVWNAPKNAPKRAEHKRPKKAATNIGHHTDA